MMEKLISAVKFDANGLVCAVAQDHETGEVLMLAWMNREALEKTIAEKRACYWSRSRKKLWVKGESSGHTQIVHDLRIDCDGDAVLLKVQQAGGACHTGFRSCFYRSEKNGEWVESGEKIFESEKVYGR